MTRLGSSPCSAPDGLAVEPELAVVVVLDDPSSGLTRPLDEGDPTAGRHRDAERVLVGGGDQHALGDTRAKPIDLQAIVVDGHSLDRKTGASAEVGMEGERRILDGDGRASQLSKRLGEDREGLGEAAEDDDLVGMGADCARPTEVRGERDSELANATWVAVAEQVVSRRVHRVPDRREPRPARERRCDRARPAGSPRGSGACGTAASEIGAAASGAVETRVPAPGSATRMPSATSCS